MKSNDKNNMAQGWPEAGQFKRSIRLEFTLYFSGLILVLMLVTGYVFTNLYVNTVTGDVVDKLLVQARAYSGPAGKHIIANENPDVLMLNNICRKLSADNPDLYWAGVTGTDYVFLAHSDIKQVLSKKAMLKFTGEEFEKMLRPGENFVQRADTIYISIPILENNITLGYLGVASSIRQIEIARQTSIITVGTITFLMILLGLPLVMFSLHRKLRPVSTITDALKHIKYDDISLDIPIKSHNEFGYLAETLRVMGSKLNTARQEMVEKERIARELEIAREIQTNILPREYPRESEYEFYGAYASAREVGGDYYDFIDFGNDYLGYLVADVSGKSLPGMLVMLLTRDIVKKLTRVVRQPGELLSEVNRELLVNIKKGMFVTMFFGLLNKKTGRFAFASAGHNPLILMNGKTGEHKLLNPRGYPLGMMPAVQFEKRIENLEISLEENDWLVQYTDGVNEAQNQKQEMYGMDRFVDEVKANRTLSPKDIVSKIFEKINIFSGTAPQYDDITLLAMKWYGQKDDINNINKNEVLNEGRY